jgi:hypothetical protein
MTLLQYESVAYKTEEEAEGFLTENEQEIYEIIGRVVKEDMSEEEGSLLTLIYLVGGEDGATKEAIEEWDDSEFMNCLLNRLIVLVALSQLERKGLIQSQIDDDGEMVFSQTELGKQIQKEL